MPTVIQKEEAHKLVDRLPASSTWDDRDGIHCDLQDATVKTGAACLLLEGAVALWRRELRDADTHRRFPRPGKHLSFHFQGLGKIAQIRSKVWNAKLNNPLNAFRVRLLTVRTGFADEEEYLEYQRHRKAAGDAKITPDFRLPARLVTALR